GPDVEVGSPTWDLFVADVVREMTQKAGQKCTAVRRVVVPETLADAAVEALVERLRAVKVGDPADGEVTMGPLATRAQLGEVRRGVALLRNEARRVLDGSEAPAPTKDGKGWFVGPTLLRVDAAGARAAQAVHDHEVFGPAATVCLYDGQATSAAEL